MHGIIDFCCKLLFVGWYSWLVLLVCTIGCWLVLLVGTIGCWLVQVLEVQLLDCKVDPTPGRSLAGFANSCNWAIHDLQFPQKLL